MSHKNDSPNLTKKSSDLLMDWWSICLSYFFSCFNSVDDHKHLSGLFSGNLPAMVMRSIELMIETSAFIEAFVVLFAKFFRF